VGVARKAGEPYGVVWVEIVERPEWSMRRPRACVGSDVLPFDPERLSRLREE